MPDRLPGEVERTIEFFQRREEVVPSGPLKTAQRLFDLGQTLLSLGKHVLHGRNDVLRLDPVKAWQAIGDEQWVVVKVVGQIRHESFLSEEIGQ